MKICLITDAWHPQINGVVTTIENLIKQLETEHEIILIEPSQFRTFPFPLYPEIRLALNPRKAIQTIKDTKPDTIHIFTEGTLGIAVRNYCVKNNIPFTTSAHTKFPEYLCKRFPFLPIGLPRAVMRWFHSGAAGTLVNTKSHREELSSQGFKNLTLWTRGIDRSMFNRSTEHPINRLTDKKHLLYVGRVAKAKNINAFCELSKNPDYQCWVVGNGPKRKKLERKWGKQINFVGYQTGENLANYYRLADVCVFPSLTDTFGVTIIESIACGTPVAAYPVTGPQDVITPGVNGVLHQDLSQAVAKVLQIDTTNISESIPEYTWEHCSKIFHQHLAHV